MPTTDAPTALAQPTLATDLDGTFALGPAWLRAQLVDALAAAPDGCLLYVTGRTVPAWRELAAEAGLPVPFIAITDVGTEVVDGDTARPITAITDTLARDWPGHDVVRERLFDHAGIAEQSIVATRRVSYTFTEGASVGDSVREAAARLRDLPVDVLPSAGVYLDVLPRGVNKGTTLLRVLEHLGRAPESTVVAGDTLNDLPLFATGLRGVVVGNAEPALKHRLAGQLQIHFATSEGIEGVAEGLAHFGLLPDPAA